MAERYRRATSAVLYPPTFITSSIVEPVAERSVAAVFRVQCHTSPSRFRPAISPAASIAFCDPTRRFPRGATRT
jgi:hypothetical protein